MKTAPSLLRLREFPRRLGLRRLGIAAALVLLANGLLPSSQATTVKSVAGGPTQNNPQSSSGYADGAIVGYAQFHTPYGLAIDSSGQYLFVADRDNDAIRMINFNTGFAFTAIPNESTPTNLIHKPIAVALDEAAGNIFVLNRGNGTNGTLLQFDTLYGELVATNAIGLVNAAGMTIDTVGNLYVTVQSNTVIRLAPPYTTSTVVATVTNANASLQGIAVMHSGMIAACDSSRNGIYNIDPATGIVTTNAGFHGVGDFPTNSLNFQSPTLAKFNQPYGVAVAGDDSLIVTDNGNQRVKVVLPTGAVSNLYGVNAVYWYENVNATPEYLNGWVDGTVAVPDYLAGVAARQPVGVVFGPDGAVYVSEDYYHLIRKVTGTGLVLPPPPPPPAPAAPINLSATADIGSVALSWSAVSGATNYLVKSSPSHGGPYTTIGSTSSTHFTYTDVLGGQTIYFVVTAVNAGGSSPISAEVSVTVPQPAVPNPQIGYVDFPPLGVGSVFHPVSSAVFNNDANIVIVGAAGSQTYYEFRPTLVLTNVPDPTSSSSSAPAGYQDGLSSVAAYTVATVAPQLSIKAVGKQTGHPDSAITSGQFEFVVGNPLITGNNVGQFNVNDITTGSEVWYTTDGTEPTNGAPSQLAGTITGDTNGLTLSLSFPVDSTNLVFKARGFKTNYQPSGTVITYFSKDNFTATKITFGFAAGEASSAFVASPGQNFIAPVTLNTLPETKIYSLQFNLTATNLNGPAIAPGAIDFTSMLVKPIPGSDYMETIPPAMFISYFDNPPPTDTTFVYDGTNFVSLLVTNSALNLLGVGWVERATETNLFNTKSQDLITYSMAHDTLFLSSGNKIVVGGFSFAVPSNSVAGQTYQIQIGRPSATSDGIGRPGYSVYIDTPTNGDLAAGSINATKVVTVGQRKYVVGDAAPFRWFNAGDFGNTNLLNDDVEQVFQSAIYQLNTPPHSTDFFDGMDSCCGVYTNSGVGYLTPQYQIGSVAALNALFHGNDATIDTIAFGDGILDVTDVYVTYRRSLDPSRVWFQRFWTNGIRGAESTANVYHPAALVSPKISTKGSVVGGTNSIQGNIGVVFTAGDAITGPGQTLIIPISARVYGSYPLKVLMLNLTVEPLDGSPAITTPVQFFPDGAFGSPYASTSQDPANYGAVWLNTSAKGIATNGLIGNLQITLPAGATASSAYAVHFDHASGSPNGVAPFPYNTFTGLITLGDRSASSWGDGIPDSWRLRNFGSIYNQLSAAHADADGDNADNLAEYQAGTNPNDASSVLRLRSPDSSTPNFTIRWPSVVGKQYIIERSPTLFGNNWEPISTNAGTGIDMQFQDPTAVGSSLFYRVRVAQ